MGVNMQANIFLNRNWFSAQLPPTTTDNVTILAKLKIRNRTSHLELHDLKWQVDSGVLVFHNKIPSLLGSSNHLNCFSFLQKNFAPVICKEKDENVLVRPHVKILLSFKLVRDVVGSTQEIFRTI